jgi:hypothetical protein
MSSIAYIYLQTTLFHSSLWLIYIYISIAWLLGTVLQKNSGVQISLLYFDLHFFGYIPRRGIAGSYGSFSFSFLRSLHNVFHSSYTNLHSHLQCMWAPFSPHPCQHMLFFSVLGGSHSNRSDVES